MQVFMVIVIIACGAFSICGGVFDWDWFMNNYKARPLVAIFGRTGARIFYIALGIIIIGCGVAAGVAM